MPSRLLLETASVVEWLVQIIALKHHLDIYIHTHKFSHTSKTFRFHINAHTEDAIGDQVLFLWHKHLIIHKKIFRKYKYIHEENIYLNLNFLFSIISLMLAFLYFWNSSHKNKKNWFEVLIFIDRSVLRSVRLRSHWLLCDLKWWLCVLLTV